MLRNFALLAGLIAVPIAAQISQPKRHDTQSSTGVSYRSGAFNLSEEDLSIGGSGSEGLSLRRIYASNMQASGAMLGFAAGWSDNYASSITSAPAADHPDISPTPPIQQVWIYNVNTGGKTYGFIGGTNFSNGTGVGHKLEGTYTALSRNGVRLVFNGTNSTGYYTLTEADGTVTNFSQGISTARVTDVNYPDGTILQYSYDVSAGLRAIFSTRGYALLFNGTNTMCVVNLANYYVTPTSACPTNAVSVTYAMVPGVLRPTALLASVTKGSDVTTYSYDSGDHLACVKDPGMSVCRITNQYATCLPNQWDPSDHPVNRRWQDPVTTQQTATGQTYTYTLTPSPCDNTNPGEPSYYAWTDTITAVQANDGSQTTVGVSASGMPGSVTDQLGRTTLIGYESATAGATTEVVDPNEVIAPEGNTTHYDRDARGNILSARIAAKSGSGLPTLASTAVYPSTCTNQKTCNKPTSVTDANGNQTDFTYDSTHGRTLTETLPADTNGIRAQKRYGYVQRYTWLKNSGGTFSQTATAVWLLYTMKTCRTTATVSGACAGGSADEVVTSYDYGPDTGSVGNNLLLRGVSVTADGQTRRTCYGYDGQGNRIWETKPRAGLAACY